jgi:hypothetical protein
MASRRVICGNRRGSVIIRTLRIASQQHALNFAPGGLQLHQHRFQHRNHTDERALANGKMFQVFTREAIFDAAHGSHPLAGRRAVRSMAPGLRPGPWRRMDSRDAHQTSLAQGC